MKKLYYLIFPFFLFSCFDMSKKAESKKLNYEKYIDSILVINKGFKSNTILLEEVNKNFKNSFTKKFQQNIFSDFPFKLININKCNNDYILEFSHSSVSSYFSQDEFRDIVNSTNIEIYAKIPETEAKQLIENEYYIISGKIINYLTLENKNKYCINSLYSPYTGFDKDYGIEFGSIFIDLENIKLIK
ncbi:hypothetical protein [Soonwooa purpurea]